MGVYGSLYLVATGGGFVLAAIVQIAKTIRFFTHSTETKGVVTSLEEKQFRYKTYFYPRIEYIDHHNQPVSFIGGLGRRNKPGSYIGRQVKVRYLPAREGHPVTARLWTLSSILAGPLAFLILGGILLVVAATS